MSSSVAFRIRTTDRYVSSNSFRQCRSSSEWRWPARGVTASAGSSGWLRGAIAEVVGEGEGIGHERPQRREPLPAVNDRVDLRGVLATQIVEVELGDVVAVEDRVDEQLLLGERPDRALALVGRVLLDCASPAERLADREVLGEDAAHAQSPAAVTRRR